MSKQIIYKPNYITIDEVNEIRDYFDKINDSLLASRGPRTSVKNKLGWEGCWDRQLHWEKTDNPIHKVVTKLKNDFGNFEVAESSIRYLSAPFLPHSDVKSLEWIEDQKKQNRKEGPIILIALWWDRCYTPGTAFYNSPPNLDELLYSEKLDILPNYSNEYQEDMRNFSVREIIKWQSPGDLIAWENFQFHSSCHFGNVNYDRTKWVKEFISIETYFV
jgi:hypothetical protein